MGTAAEAAGFDSVWTFEHVVAPRGYESRYPYNPSGKAPMLEEVDLPDPLVWLTWVGAHTTDLLLGTGILILPQRNPLVLAKELATLHALSRVDARASAIGAGWLREEFEALGRARSSGGACARTSGSGPCVRCGPPAPRVRPSHGELVDVRATACRCRRRPAGRCRSRSAATPRRPHGVRGGSATATSRPSTPTPWPAAASPPRMDRLERAGRPGAPHGRGTRPRPRRRWRSR